MPTMNDSGQREIFTSGAVRDSDEDKPRPELISPFAMERLAKWLTEGAKKYAPRNWEKGIGIERCFASMYRHLLKYQMGEHDEDHIAALFCNCMMILDFEEKIKRGLLPPSLLDMPKYRRPSSYYEGTPKIVTDKDGAKIITVDDEPLYRAEDGEA
ncbi:MAG: DUF5664 domain-containing protein [Planctomycetaceae bacterium]|nr:DUF5664 domain-containing protein [Planctomycetaceae bacterium]